ncbi:LacI family DNA-binding transcriptional regulator [Sphingomonas sp. LB2R24]|uniref:LacI family DNA-binding transcriptional regulator n=1 Tax=Sphingomonas sorbitolis TaxID=3096165 RepID=UPI002FCB728D
MNKNAGGPVRPTMAAIAELAGVSKITVSRALNGSELVRPEVRERIAEVARAAGYRLNVAARSLRTRRSRTVAVVVEKLVDGARPIADPVLLLLLGGLLEVLTPADHAMLVTTRDHFLGSLGISADGIIMIGQGQDGSRVGEIAASGLPIVIWGAGEAGSANVIGSDNRLGGYLAAEHMIATGRRRILFVGDPAHPEVARRLDGVRDRLAASESMLIAVAKCEFSRPGGARAVEDALASGTVFDAVIAVSDYIAAGACDTLIGRGMAIPGDVAVIGFDDVAVAANHRPPISSIRQDWHAAGRALAQALLAQLGESGEMAETLLPVELIIRESTAG